MRVRESRALDCYAELGVATTASRDEITAAFRRLVKELHPDTGESPASSGSAGLGSPGNGSVATEERLSRVTTAYRVLASPDSRARYDAELRATPGRSTVSTATRPAREPVRPRHREFLTRKRAKWFVGSGIVLFVAGVAVSILVIGLMSSDSALRANGRPAVATAVERDGHLVLAFDVDGHRVITDLPRKTGIDDPSLGDTVDILYDPSDPSTIVADASTTARDITFWIVAAKLLVGGVILTGAGLWRFTRP